MRPERRDCAADAVGVAARRENGSGWARLPGVGVMGRGEAPGRRPGLQGGGVEGDVAHLGRVGAQRAA
jgi:hypothetical protein